MKKNCRFTFLSILIAIGFFLLLELIGRLAGFELETWSLPHAQFGYVMRQKSHDFSNQKEPPTQLLLLGDSITYARSLPNTSFSTLLRQKDLGVINLSAIGYGTDQALLYLKSHLKDLGPTKFTVLNFCLFNDLIDNSNRVNPHDGFRPKPFFTLENNQLILHQEHLTFSRWNRLNLYVRERSGALELLRKVLKKAHLLPEARHRDPSQFKFPTIKRLPTNQEFQDYQNRLREAMPLTKILLQNIKTTTEENLQSQFLVLLYPSGYDPLGVSFPALSKDLDDFFKTLDFPVYDLGCYFRQQNLKFDQYTKDLVGHLNERGHEEVADWLEKWMKGQAPFGECFLRP